MDRDDQAERPQHHVAPDEVLISVCTTCKSASGETGIGDKLFDALHAAIDDDAARLRRVQS